MSVFAKPALLEKSQTNPKHCAMPAMKMRLPMLVFAKSAPWEKSQTCTVPCVQHVNHWKLPMVLFAKPVQLMNIQMQTRQHAQNVSLFYSNYWSKNTIYLSMGRFGEFGHTHACQGPKSCIFLIYGDEKNPSHGAITLSKKKIVKKIARFPHQSIRMDYSYYLLCLS